MEDCAEKRQFLVADAAKHRLPYPERSTMQAVPDTTLESPSWHRATEPKETPARIVVLQPPLPRSQTTPIFGYAVFDLYIRNSSHLTYESPMSFVSSDREVGVRSGFWLRGRRICGHLRKGILSLLPWCGPQI